MSKSSHWIHFNIKHALPHLDYIIVYFYGQTLWLVWAAQHSQWHHRTKTRHREVDLFNLYIFIFSNNNNVHTLQRTLQPRTFHGPVDLSNRWLSGQGFVWSEYTVTNTVCTGGTVGFFKWIRLLLTWTGCSCLLCPHCSLLRIPFQEAEKHSRKGHSLYIYF